MADRHVAIYTTGDTAIFDAPDTPLGRVRRREIAAMFRSIPSDDDEGERTRGATRAFKYSGVLSVNTRAKINSSRAKIA